MLMLVMLYGALASSSTASCTFPGFSHTDEETLSWLANRGKHKQAASERPGQPRDWSKYGKGSSVKSLSNVNSTEKESEEFLNFVHGVKDADLLSKFYLFQRGKPKIKGEAALTGENYGQTSVAAVNLKAGDTLLEIPIHYCLSDEISRNDPSSLRGSPWELRLATKILRERSKYKDSPWYYFIKLLPGFIRLPLFFSESELNNCEDVYIRQEVQLLREFAEASFHALHQHETAGAGFQDFVWALAVVYTSACRGYSQKMRHAYGHSPHLLVPFFGSMSDSSSAKVYIELDNQSLKLVLNQEASEGSRLFLENNADMSSESFVFHGFVPTNLPHDRTRIFGDLQDLVDWFLSTYGGERNQKDVMMMHAESALQDLQENLRQSNDPRCREKSRKMIPLVPDYSVGINGYIDPHMISVLVTLYSNQRNTYDGYIPNTVEDFIQGDMDFLDRWFMRGNESLISSKLAIAVCMGAVDHATNNASQNAFLFTISALQKRLLTLLDSFSTDLEEDASLLRASLWEGFSDDGGSHLCETCQWQTEELSFNDYLAVQLRYRTKLMLLEALSMLSCDYKTEKYLLSPRRQHLASIDNRNHSNEEFLKWCEQQGAKLSDKLAIVHFSDEANLMGTSNPVRGVQALQDIEQGETICILPLKMGLFDQDSVSFSGADSWHLAAAYLLREKSLGVSSRWASYISILPKTMPTPIYLNADELSEVQWWPVLRELIQIRQAIKRSFSHLTGPTLAWADFDEYRWAATMVHSRAFTLPVGEDEQYASYVLMPFMDMINHHFEYQADWMSLPVREGKLEIVAKRPVFKGQEVFASFGPRSNDNLFLYYGFVLENNPFDSVQIFSSFEDGVQWFTGLWRSNCNGKKIAIRERCKQKNKEQQWLRAKVAIEEYAAGVTEQRPEWWNLVNTWAEYGYEYMQFQPSPSIYADGIVDPSLLIALESAASSLYFENFSRHDLLEDCKRDACNLESPFRSKLREILSCIDSTEWLNGKWAPGSVFCSEVLSQSMVGLDKQSYTTLVVKVSLALRCVEILNSFPTTIEEDKLLLEEINASRDQNTSHSTHMHLSLTRQYRYIKKLFLKKYIHHVLINF